jgi:hypothetical protein
LPCRLAENFREIGAPPVGSDFPPDMANSTKVVGYVIQITVSTQEMEQYFYGVKRD